MKRDIGEAERESESTVMELSNRAYEEICAFGDELLERLPERIDQVRAEVERVGEEKEIALWKLQNDKLVERMAVKLAKKGVKAEEFYRQGWKHIVQSVFFDSEEERKKAFYVLYVEPALPFYQMAEGLRMENEHFKEISAKLQNYYKKIDFILYNSFEQKAERASLINDIFDMVEDREERAVLMAYFIERMKKDGKE